MRVLSSLAIGWTAAIAVFFLARLIVPNDIYVDMFDSRWAERLDATYGRHSMIACYGDGCVYTAAVAPWPTLYTSTGGKYRPGTAFLLGLLVMSTATSIAVASHQDSHLAEGPRAGG